MTKGRAFPSGSFLLKATKTPVSVDKKEQSGSFVSFLAPKKAFTTAVLRNRARRRAKAAFQKVLKNGTFPSSISSIFLLRPQVLHIELNNLVEEMELVIKKMYTR